MIDNSPGLTVVVPTRHETENAPELLRRLESVHARADIERVIFIDDSDDETPSVLRRLGRSSALPVVVLHRDGEARSGGLSGAVAVGLAAATSEWIVVMDGDLQHPPELIEEMAASAARGAEIVVASRYCNGGSADGLTTGRRRLVSRVSGGLARLCFPRKLRECTDPMTGFFLVRRDRLRLEYLRPKGFKILLEILARHDLVVKEVPLAFGHRENGVSKASLRQGRIYVQQLATLRWVSWWMGLGRTVGALPGAKRVGRFSVVGFVNLVVDILLFNAILSLTAAPLISKGVSGSVAVMSSFAMNRRWTWGDRAAGRVRRQLPLFIAISVVGVLIAEALLLITHYGLGFTSPLADNLSTNGLGLVAATVWRFYAYHRWVFTSSDPTVVNDHPTGMPSGRSDRTVLG